ncbi:hypothetical protein AB0M46_07585 [Dactylosporangium sp. NPDC051485]|uniref:hypothetical protein n=1 Tax=Dactylosporangium sp. NPDC051485 TaxID=3154846 RepID=UPI00341DE1B5
MLLSDHSSRVATGQTYAVAGRQGDWTAIWYLGQKGWFYYHAVTFDGSGPGDRTVIRGDTRYAQIQFGHRLMYVNLADVQLLPSPLGAP